ncbi:MAG: IS1634 family transposase [Bacilli bacterium]
MRLRISKSKNVTLFYVIKTIYINGKQKTKTIEKLGNEQEVIEKSNGEDPIIWAKKYIEELNKKEKENTNDIIIKKSQTKQIEKDSQNLYNCGYLFLEKIYYDLKLDKICEDISDDHQFKYDLNNILSNLIFGRIIFPSSKLATNELSKTFIEQPNFKLHDIYRALEVIAKKNDFIQSELYKNSLKIIDRNSKILYYDCTNYFFEIEEEKGIRKYGASKEHRPNPIVQMGLFMDGNGIPLAFNINAGNTNEQITMTPLEKKIIKDFDVSKFVVCTDAGLASNANRLFNNKKDRAFITTQSIKKLKKYQKEWALESTGWQLTGSDKTYDISKIEDTEENKKLYKDKTFYKERWLNENGLEQKFIVTYSLKYKYYQEKIRNSQIERAKNAIENNPSRLDKNNQNDYKRFIKKTSVTKNGEHAEKEIFTIDKKIIEKESQYDGFYGVCTNLDDTVEDIIKVNHMRWKIEESFRIMKTEFKSRPVYLSNDDRIQAHFMTCYISLLIHRILEKKLEEKYTTFEIINCLRKMNMINVETEGYIPTYTRTDLTDSLHDKFGFRTDFEITSENKMKKILKDIKK